MDITQAIEIVKKTYPDAVLYTCAETEELFFFSYNVERAGSCSIVVEKNTSNCSIVHFKKLIHKKIINITDLK